MKATLIALACLFLWASTVAAQPATLAKTVLLASTSADCAAMPVLVAPDGVTTAYAAPPAVVATTITAASPHGTAARRRDLG